MNINSSISDISKIHTLTAAFVTSRLNEKGFEDFASSHGNILFQLKSSGKMTMKELAEKINRDKSTTTVLVRRLEKDGLVALEQPEDDKRVHYVYLTENGKKYNEVTEEISRELLDTVYRDFSEEEKNNFLLYLEKIENNLSKK